MDEKQLKDVFGLAGKVVSVSINKDREGNSKGHGVVEFEHPVEAVQAISMLNNQMYMDRTIRSVRSLCYTISVTSLCFVCLSTDC